jgi:branched-chain amino acid transport system substrate-binding protein
MRLRPTVTAAATMALAVATAAGASTASAKTTARAAATSCTASIAIEGPFTGPVAQLGLEQLHFAELAIANANKQYGMKLTLTQDDTQLTPSIATTKTQSIIASNAVAVVGPAGSQEVEAVGPLFGRAGLAFISGSATLPALASSANPTFFRTVPDDNVQGPQDANYIIKHLHPKAVLLVDDDEAYSQGLANVMTPILKKAGITVNRQTYNGTDTGATLANALSSLVTSQLTSAETVTILPWQTAANAEMFGQDAQQQGKKTTIFGTDGTDSPSQFTIPGSYVSNFGPDISTSKSALDKSIVKGVAKYGPYGAFGVPTYAAAQVAADAVHAVCAKGATPTKTNVLAAIRKTDIPSAKNPLGVKLAFTSKGDLVGSPGYLFKINSAKKYISIPNK